ncbi:MAG: methylenetetrahydrofolate reductase [Acidimicrobiales bacterium]
MTAKLERLSDLVEHARYEVIPTKTTEARVLERVGRSRTVTITASSAQGIEATIDLALRLSGHGYKVVPHLSARLIVDEMHLKEIVGRLVEVGVDDVFVPAGDADPPAGKFDSSLDVLVELGNLGNPFSRVGITGYPDKHPKIMDDVTVQAMWDKRHYATYIVSNLCFDASLYRRWVRRVRERGVMLPIVVGLAGPVDSAKLISIATQIGVDSSKKMLFEHGSWFARFLTPGGYNPTRLLRKLEGTITDPRSDIEGLHVFTFNQLEKTEEWRRSLSAGGTN